EYHDPPRVVDTGDQLTHPDAAELPVGELRWRTRRRLLSAGHAEHRSLEHGLLDRLSLRRAGGAARQNMKSHIGFGFGVPTRSVATLEPFDGRDGRRRRRDRHAGT